LRYPSYQFLWPLGQCERKQQNRVWGRVVLRTVLKTAQSLYFRENQPANGL